MRQSLAQSLFWELYEQLKSLDEQINSYDHKIKQLCRESEVCQRLLQVEGVGPLTASALIAAVGDSTSAVRIPWPCPAPIFQRRKASLVRNK